MVLYRKYRPQNLAEIIGQEQIKNLLKVSLEKGNVSHAYLFSGPRGTGKTSTARILAKILNCEKNKDGKFGEPCGKCASCLSIANGSHLDLIEIDAASNRGIDEIRDLREKIKLSPASGKYKIYIIDEAHMLTAEAFNALLKTLEEPPAHAIFVLATTEAQKIPDTVISRTTRFDFKMPYVSEIKEKLEFIAKKENWSISKEALEEIAALSKGAFRDAEVLLEKISSVDTKASLEKVREILGKRDPFTAITLLKTIESGDSRQALIELTQQLNSGLSPRVLDETILETLRKVLVIKAGAEKILEPISPEELSHLKELAQGMTKERALKLTELFNKSIADFREAVIPSLPLEMAVVEATLENSDQKPVIRDQKVENKKEKIIDETTAKEPDIEVEIEDIEVEAPKENGSVEKKKLPSEEKILKSIKAKWEEILKEARTAHSSLGLFLRSAKPLEVEEDLVILEFGYSFHKEKAEEKKYKDMLEDVLEKVVGVNLRIKGVIGERPLELEEKQPPMTNKEEVDPVEVFGKLE